MNYIIFGGSGFIGTHLIKLLKETACANGEHGNFTRLYWAMRKRYFVYTGRKDTIKACIYVKELVRFFKYRMIDHSFAGVDLYNCTFEPAYTIEQICNEMQKATNMQRYIPMIPA